MLRKTKNIVFVEDFTQNIESVKNIDAYDYDKVALLELLNSLSVQIENIQINNDYAVVEVSVKLLKNNVPPYVVSEALSIGEYKVIIDDNVIIEDNVTIKPQQEETFTFQIAEKNNLFSSSQNEDLGNKTFKGKFIIDKKSIPSKDSIKIVINSFFIHAKAEQPMEIIGEWFLEVPLE